MEPTSTNYCNNKYIHYFNLVDSGLFQQIGVSLVTVCHNMLYTASLMSVMQNLRVRVFL